MKKDKTQDLFFDCLRKIPIVQIACEKTGIARSTAYRWCDESPEFKKKFEEALREGEKVITEMAKSGAITLIRDKHWPAISFWLRKRDPDFRDRLDITGNITTDNEELTPEQAAIVKEGLRQGSLLAGEMPEKPPDASSESPPSPQASPSEALPPQDPPENNNKPANQSPQP